MKNRTLRVIFDSRDHSRVALVNVRLSHLTYTDQVNGKHVKGRVCSVFHSALDLDSNIY